MPEIGFERILIFATTVTLALVVSTTLLLPPQEAFAVVYVIFDQETCETHPSFPAFGVWNNSTNTCTVVGIKNLGSGNDIIIPAGVTLAIADGSIFANHFDNLLIESGGTLANFGFFFQWTPFFTNEGNVINGGTLNMLGNINNFGTFTNNPSGSINIPLGRFDNVGTFTNDGTLFITNPNGKFFNVGTFTNKNNITNNGIFINTSVPAGTLINEPGSTLINQLNGTFTNENNITNSGDITNDGTLTNNNIINNPDGTFTNNNIFINNNSTINHGTLTNNGTLTNHGTLTNNGTMGLDCSSALSGTNPGGLQVDACEPIANGQSQSMDEDTDLGITIAGSNPEVSGHPFENQTLAFFIQVQPENGTLSLAGGNTTTSAPLTYTPNANFSGSDSFTFVANDGTNDSPAATVSITVNPLNDAPAADSQNVTTIKDVAVGITLSGSDVDAGDSLTFFILTPPENGTFALITGTNSSTSAGLTYTPDANFTGTDSLIFFANDGTVDSAAATISITINLNTPPVADAQSVTTDEDEDVEITLTGGDIDNDPLTFIILTQPASGTLSGTAPNLTYTPDANFNGADSFTFLVDDGTDNSTAATVSITVNPVAEQDDDDNSSSGGGGGGGGGKRVVIINNNQQQGSGSSSVTTFPESYFADNPLGRVGVSDSGLVDSLGANIDSAAVGQQLSITGTLSNHQEAAQEYAFIVQITNEDGAVVFIGFQNGSIDSGNTADISLSWTPEEAGDYTVKIFVWDGLQPPAQPLSTVTGMNIEVTTEQ